MDSTQMLSDSILESDDEENEQENENKRRRPLAKLYILKNQHMPETEFPLFVGDNVLGRDPNSCTLPLPAPSVSKQHAIISISVYRRRRSHSEVDIEALVWDLGSMNGTHKGRIKLTPNVRYALSDGDSLVVADIPCQYVSCAVNTVLSQEDMRTPVSRNLGSGVKARLPNASGETSGNTSIGSKKCVNSTLKAGMSLTHTPVKTSCLSFEQTPTQPQGTLVPESDSDSDDEIRGGGARGHKPLVSDSDSHKSSPICSTFLSPTNKIVPESEDESPITPSSSTKNSPLKDVSLNKEETDLNEGQQQQTKTQALTILEDSEEDQGKEEERVTPEGTEFDKNGQHAAAKQERNVSLTGDELPVPPPEIFAHATPVFNMENDTDTEGEEERVTSASLVSFNQVSQPPNTDQFHMDSDTDNEDTSYRALKTVPSSNDNSKPPHVVLTIQPEGVSNDSDTDVDDDTAVSDAPTKAKPMSFQSTQIADSSTQPKEFYLDSDTDVEEEMKGGEYEKCKPSSKIDACHTRLDEKSVASKSTPAAPRLHLDSDTDDEAIPTPSLSKPKMVFSATESSSTADAEAELNIRPDSDTDVEDNCLVAIPVAVTNLSVSPAIVSDAPLSDSDVNTDVDESSVLSARDMDNQADRRVDNVTDVENNKADIPGEDQIPDLCREKSPGLLLPLLQNCSTPLQLSEGEVANMETQAFLSPSLVPNRSLSCSDSQEDEDFVVAETQSFILHTRNCQGNPRDDHIKDPTQAFDLEYSDDGKDDNSSHGESCQLGLSDSSHLQCQAQVLAMESTQTFLPVNRYVEDIQAYAAISTSERTSAEKAPNLEATQAFGLDVEPARGSVIPEEQAQVDLALEATQAYISEPCSDSEDETGKDDTENTAAEAEPLKCPTSSTLAIAETQPISLFEEEEIMATDKPASIVQQVKSRTQTETEERKENATVLQTHQRLFSEVLSIAETQPIDNLEDEESDDKCDDEDSFPDPRRRKAKPLQLEEEQTQPLTNSETQFMHTDVCEAQAMAISGNEECESDITVPGPQNEEDKTAIETQPMNTVEDKERGQDLIVGFRKRRTGRGLEEGEIQLLTNSDVSTDEIQHLATTNVGQPKRVMGRWSEAGTSGVTFINKGRTLEKLHEEQQAKGCDILKTHTRGKTKALPTNREQRVKSRPHEEEEEVEKPRVRGNKSTRKEKNDKEVEEQLSNERPTESNSLKKQKPKGKEGEEKGAVNPGQQERQKMEEDEREGEQGDTERQHKAYQQEQSERIEKEKKEQERLKAENAENIKLEHERAEKETKEQGEKERYDRVFREKEEKFEREIKQNKERSEYEKAERQNEKLKSREIEKIKRKEQEEKEKLDAEKRELQLKKLERERLEIEREAKEKQRQEKEENMEEQNEPNVPIRGRRAARRTITIQPDQDVPARRTRSRSNSSNSVSSERSASSINPQDSRGRGRGRGVKRASEPPEAAIARSSNRRRTAAGGSSQQESSPLGLRSRSNSSNTLYSEVSSSSFQVRGRGGRQRGRGRKTEPDSIPFVISQSNQNPTAKPATRGQKGKKAEASSVIFQEDDKEEADSQLATTTRRRQQASENASELAASDDKDQTNTEACHDSEDLPQSKRTVRVRAVVSETVVPQGQPNGSQAKDKRIGRKRMLLENTESDSSNSSKLTKGKQKVQPTETREEKGKDETKDEIPVQVKRRGRASSAQGKKIARELPPKVELQEEGEKFEVETVEKREKGRPSAVQSKRQEVQEDNTGTSVQDAKAATLKPRTPTSSVSRKRQTSLDSSPVAKTPRSSSASPAAAAGGRLRVASQSYKVLFTGVVDEAGERVLARLGGSMAKGVADMNCLVTDKVRRTVKFLCAVAKGIPIVTTHWLEKSGKAGSFLPPDAFVVKDPEQEKKFSFSLQDSLRTASSQPLLQGYEIHITKSVKPEPVQMKDIISCSGATFLPRMPSSHKPQTVVISCEEDRLLCGPAVSASLPVFTAEFVLTGILQQKLDFQSYTLSLPTANLPPTGGKGRSRKKT
ncbi:mediator of DNA damage checkpoint protein 1 [Channa argus]|uniref:mediator of DNA damage checkpoint protein 1 n=1 Tax=Channa argus TaxID=215402 RepID=UPI002945FAD3|nr:hypothetical protein Q8A73_007781 [Channa argus]